MCSSVIQLKSLSAACTQPQQAANTLLTASRYIHSRLVSESQSQKTQLMHRICWNKSFMLHLKAVGFLTAVLSWISAVSCCRAVQRGFYRHEYRVGLYGRMGAFMPDSWRVAHQHQTSAMRSRTVLTWPDTRTSSCNWSSPDKAVGDIWRTTDSLKNN